jgi:hypothetical protein
MPQLNEFVLARQDRRWLVGGGGKFTPCAPASVTAVLSTATGFD